MTEGIETGPAPFVGRTDAEGKRRTTLDSVMVGFTTLERAGLLPRPGMAHDTAKYVTEDGRVIEDTYAGLAARCTPELLGSTPPEGTERPEGAEETDWAEAFVGHLRAIDFFQQRIATAEAARREAGS